MGFWRMRDKVGCFWVVYCTLFSWISFVNLTFADFFYYLCIKIVKVCLQTLHI